MFLRLDIFKYTPIIAEDNHNLVYSVHSIMSLVL